MRRRPFRDLLPAFAPSLVRGVTTGRGRPSHSTPAAPSRVSTGTIGSRAAPAARAGFHLLAGWTSAKQRKWRLVVRHHQVAPSGRR